MGPPGRRKRGLCVSPCIWPGGSWPATAKQPGRRSAAFWLLSSLASRGSFRCAAAYAPQRPTAPHPPAPTSTILTARRSSPTSTAPISDLPAGGDRVSVVHLSAGGDEATAVRSLTRGDPLLACNRRHLRRMRSPSIIWCHGRGPRRRTRSGVDSFQPCIQMLLPFRRCVRAAVSPQPRPPAPTSMIPFARRPFPASTAPISVALAPHPHTIPAPSSSRLRPAPPCVCVSVPLSGRQSPRSNALTLPSPRPASPSPPRPRLGAHDRAPTSPSPEGISRLQQP